jgi:hypothetical protein
MAQSALFHRVTLRFSGAILLGIASSSVALLCGCDNATSKTDKQVNAQLSEAQTKIDSSSVTPTVSNGDLDAAARETGDSLPVQIHAKVAFADSELMLAQAAADQVLANDQQIDRLTREIGLLTGQIESNNQMVEALTKYDPSKAVPQGKSVSDAVNDTKAAVTGSDEKPDWIKTGDTTSLAALSTIDKKSAALQAEISRLSDAIRTQTEQRNTLLDQADKLTQQSQHEQRDKSVELFTQGSEARKKAADVTVRIDADSAALAQNQADLSMQQGQHDALTATLAGINAKANAVDADWKAIQSQISGLNTASVGILGDEPSAPPVIIKGDLKTDPTIASKASAIHQLGDDNRKLRSVAETHFDKAIALYGEAASLATRVTSELRTRAATADQNKPERAAWTAETNALDSNTYEFLQADAQMQRGNFNARSATEAKVRLDTITALKPVLAPVLESDKRPMPPSLDENNPDLAKQAKDAAGTGELGARGSYAKAVATFEKVAGSTAPMELRSAAKADQIFTQYNWAALEAAAGDAQAAAQHLELARGLVNGAATESIPLPPMPAELAAPAPLAPPVPMSPAPK